jgi:hypothetical protein
MSSIGVGFGVAFEKKADVLLRGADFLFDFPVTSATFPVSQKQFPEIAWRPVRSALRRQPGKIDY